MILNEDAVFSKLCKNPVYIVLMNGKSPLSSIILKATGDYFSHACIAFNDDLDPLYSFGAKSKTMQKGGMGFCISKPTDLSVFNKQAYYAVYVTYVTDEAYAKMKERLSYFTTNANKMIYDYVGLLNVWMHQSSDNRTRAYFCSRFVMDIIGAGIKLDKLPSLYRPQDIASMNNISLVNRGFDFHNYDKKITQKNEKLLKQGKLNPDDIIFEDVSSVIQKDFKSKHDMNLSQFEKMRLSDAAIQVYKQKLPSLSHVRINNNTKGYIWIDKKTDMPAAIVNVEEKDDGFTWIQAFEIFVPYKGHGLSKDILNVAIRELKATNLSVNKDNQVAIKIYKSYGFKTYKTTESMYFMSIDKNAFDDNDDEDIYDESTIMESVSPKIYFLSNTNMDGKVLSPRIPSNFMTKNGYEESKTPRVCFSTSIDGSLMGLSQNLKDKDLYVHIPNSEVSVYKPSVKQVPDCKITGEVWVKDKVNIKCIGKIKVIKDKGLPGHRYMYGDGKSAELYDWDWKWEEKYSINESVIIESYNPHYTYSKLSSQKEISDFKNSMKIVFNSNDKPTDKLIKSMKKIEDNGTVIGYIGFSSYKIDGKKYLGIGNFMVLPQYQSKGYGANIINDIININKNKYDEIYCYVEESNTRAISFYKRVGKVGHLTDYGYYYVVLYSSLKHINESTIMESKNPYSKAIKDISSTPKIEYDRKAIRSKYSNIIFNSLKQQFSKKYKVCYTQVDNNYGMHDIVIYISTAVNAKEYYKSIDYGTNDYCDIIHQCTYTANKIYRIDDFNCYIILGDIIFFIYGAIVDNSGETNNTVEVDYCFDIDIVADLNTIGSKTNIEKSEALIVLQELMVNKIKDIKFDIYKDMLVFKNIDELVYNKISSKLKSPHYFNMRKVFNSKKQGTLYLISDKININESTILETGLPFKLYHGSRYLFDELRPFGIDFGNSFQDPGWSLFTWTKHASAMGWGCWEVFRHLSKIDDKIVLNGCLNSQTTVLWQSVYNYLKENIHKYSEKDLSFYVYTIPTRSEYEYGLGHSSNTPNCITIRTDHIKYSEVNKYILTIDLVDKYCKIVPDGYKPTGKEYGLNKRLTSFFMKYDYMYQPEVKKSINNAIKNGEISPGDDISVFLKDNNIDLKTINFKERLDDIISNESTIEDFEIEAETGFYDKHNRWNPIVIINGEQYRHRVECLIMRQNKLFVAKSNTGALLIPGGGVDKSLSDEEQVYNECKEEARILVENIKPTGYAYLRRTGVSESAKRLPKEQQWVGSYTEIYIADYAKDFTGFIDYCDRDSEMIRGDFRPISEIVDKLVPEWKLALIDANYISVATEALKSYKDPKLALKRRMGIKRNNAVKLGDFSNVAKSAPTPQAQTISVPSPAVSSSAPSSAKPAQTTEETKEIPETVKANANRLLCKEIASYPKFSGCYYNMDYPLYNGNGHAIVGWKMTGVHYNDFDSFNMHRDRIYEYCSKIFEDTNPGYGLKMDKKTNCIYITEI